MRKDLIEIEKLKPEYIKKEVIMKTLNNMFTLTPFFAGLISTSLWAILDYSIIFLLGGALSSFVISPFMFYLVLIKDGHNIENEYIKKLKKQANDEYEKNLKQVENFFSEYNMPEASEQIKLVLKKQKSFEDVLGQRFDKTEIAYNRYHSVADQTSYSILYNLNEIKIKINSISGINEKEINKKINNLKKNGATESEIFVLQERLDIKEKTVKKIKELLMNNEKAMTELDKFTNKIAELNTDNFDPEKEMVIALKNIINLTNEADKLFK